jgi:uncharacterized membrane protein
MLTQYFDTWTSFYSKHAMLRTTITFIHVGGLMAGGGCAIAADLVTIEAVREGPIGRTTQLHVLNRTHSIVAGGLVALVLSGLLLFAADAETFLHSRVFWLKMALMVALMLNGMMMLAGERQVQRGDARAWMRLHNIAATSLALWFATTLVGAALPNI